MVRVTVERGKATKEDLGDLVGLLVVGVEFVVGGGVNLVLHDPADLAIRRRRWVPGGWGDLGAVQHRDVQALFDGLGETDYLVPGQLKAWHKT